MRKIILDVDTGIDDALALLYAVGEERADLIGVTTTFGNIDLKQATKNTLSILNLAGRTDIPVYQGAEHSLVSTEYNRREVTSRIHGKDGIGDANITASKRQPEDQHAVDFLIAAALEFAQDLTLICVGPLTNLALAYEKNPTALQGIGEVVIMGGALTVSGNASKFAEANIIEDATAAKRILESGLSLKMVGLDVTIRTILTSDETKIWDGYATDRSQAVVKMTEHYFKSYQERLGMLGCALHDPLAVGIALYPELAETLAIDLTVELEEPAKGLTVGSYEKIHHDKPSTDVSIQVDQDRFLTLFMKAMENVLKA